MSQTSAVDGWKFMARLVRAAAEAGIDLEKAIKFMAVMSVDEDAKAVAKELTRPWDRNNTDMAFGRGVKEALKYGAAVLKQWPQNEGPDNTPV